MKNITVDTIRRLITVVAITVFGSLTVASTHAQVSLTGNPNPFTENFNNYRGSNDTLPAGFTVGSGSFQGTGTGTSNTGGYYAYVPNGTNTDYSFGVLRSGSGVFTMNATFVNNTGTTLTSLMIGFDYEQYRFANTSGISVTGTGAISSQILSNLNITGSATGTNGTPLITAESLMLNNLSIVNGASFGIAFSTVDASGSDNGIAIDNFSLGYAPVPEPATVAAGLLALGTLGWSQRRRLRGVLTVCRRCLPVAA